MQVRMKKTLTVFLDGVRGSVLREGEVVDIPDQIARSLVVGEFAEDASEQQQPEKMLASPENKAIQDAARKRGRGE